MRKRLTARCAIKMRSMESDKKAVIQKLQHDLHNSPLHCFGIHDNCNTDFCKIVQQRASGSADSTVILDLDSDLRPPPPTRSGTPAFSSTQPTSSATDTGSSSSTEDDSDSSLQTILIVSQEQEEAWNDTLDETDFEGIRSTPRAQQKVDPMMLCDIQRIIGWLISKSEQLLGETKTIIVSVLSTRGEWY